MTEPAAVFDESPRAFGSLTARFVASLIDLAVLTVPSLILERLLVHQGRAADFAITVLTSVYFVLGYSAAGNGYSVGKFVLGIRVVNASGEPLSVAQAAMRWFMSIGIALPIAFLVIGFERGAPVQTGPAFAIVVPILCIVVVDSYMALAHRVSHQSLHDLAAGSWVVRRAHEGAVPETPPLDRKHYKWMVLGCLLMALWFGQAYPWARVIGQRSVELMKARAVALATGKAKTLIVAPGFAVQNSDTVWAVSAIATIHAKPQTEFEAEALRKALACSLARSAPLSFRGAELDLIVGFDPGAKGTRPTVSYFADLELTPGACNGK